MLHVVEDEDRRSRHRVERFRQPVDRRRDHRHADRRRGCRRPSGRPIRRGRAQQRSRSGGRSGRCRRSSSVSQANGRRSFAAHCAKSVVFPYPVGATTDTSGMAREAWSRATKSVLGTRPLRRTDGGWSFVCASPERLQASRDDSGRLTTVVACRSRDVDGSRTSTPPSPLPVSLRSAPPVRSSPCRWRGADRIACSSRASDSGAIHRRGASPRRPQPLLDEHGLGSIVRPVVRGSPG